MAASRGVRFMAELFALLGTLSLVHGQPVTSISTTAPPTTAPPTTAPPTTAPPTTAPPTTAPPTTAPPTTAPPTTMAPTTPPVYLSLGGTTITTNNTEVLITTIGQDGLDGLPSLTCHTDLEGCCRGKDAFYNIPATVGGEWYYPDGTKVPNKAGTDDFARVKNAPQVVRLYRRIPPAATSPTGLYCCEIPTTVGNQTFCADLHAITCSALPGINNGYIDYSDGNTDSPSHDLGTTATHQCQQGYQIAGGDQLRTCIRNDYSVYGSWNGSALQCSVVDCGPPTSLSHGSVDASSGTTFGSLAMYSCNTGYRLVGSFRQLCGQEGMWLPEPPTCNIVKCGPLYHPNHGRVNTDSSTTFNSTATYTCNVGYKMVGPNSTVCQHDGVWSARAPVCNPVNCGPLLYPSNGDVDTLGGTTLGDRATYSCDNGYILRGSMTRICHPDGHWNQNETYCDPVDCGSLVVGNGQVDTKFGTTFGNTATYSCVVGYNLHGVVNRRCNHDGQWNPEAPLCIIVDCGPVPNIEKGGVETSSGTKYNSIATYTCIEGYVLVGDHQTHCNSNGAWSPQAPSCVPVDCGPPDVPHNGAVDTTSGTFLGNTATYSCDIGYNLTGNVKRICQSNGEWSVSAPYCADIAMVQLKFSPTSHCVEWSETRAELMYSILRGSILKSIMEKGDFSITLNEIGKGFFTCYRSKTETTYRTTITGLRDVNARTDLARPIQKWVESGPTLRVLWFIIRVDKSCSVLISSLDDDEC